MSASVKDALDVASKGFHVFPLGQNTKLPLKGSKGFKDATRDPAIIKDMWGSKHFNLGVSTHTFGDGEALAAVDIDYHPEDKIKPRNGFDVMHALDREGKKLPNTLTQRTPSGGAHFIYITDEPLQSGASVLGKEFGQGMDLRSWGGYIAMAPSQINGRKYQISNPEAPTRVPQWIKETRPLVKPSLSLVDRSDQNTLVNQAQAMDFAKDFLKCLPVSGSGSRNNDAYLAAAKIKDFGLSIQNTIDVLFSFFKAEPALEIHEIEHVVSSVSKYGQNQPGSRNPGILFESLVGNLDVENDISIAEPAQTIKRKILIERDIRIAKPPVEIVRGLLSEKDFSFIYGPPGTGKSFIAIHMGLSIAHGMPFLGHETIKRPVLYVAAEAGGSVRNRIYAWKSHFDKMDEPADFGLIAQAIDLRDPKGGVKELIESVNETGWKNGLLFVDTMNRSIGGADENDNQDVGHFMHHLGEITRHTSFGCCVVHHSGKDQSKGLRGHSSLFGNADTVLEVNGNRIAARKQKDRELGAAIPFALKPIRLDTEFGSITSCVIEGGVNADGFPVIESEETTKAREVLLWLESTEEELRVIDLKRIFWQKTGQDSSNKKTRSWMRVDESAVFEGFVLDAEGLILRVNAVD